MNTKKRPVKANRGKSGGKRRVTKRSRRKVFIAVAGNIGAGKSSLTNLLSLRYGWKPFFESVEDNPYLSDFYADMKRWSFNLQVYFLSNRFRSHKAITEGPESVILDRVIYEDAEIFARNLYEIGNMERRDYENYVALYEVMTEYLRPPDLLIYLRANVDTLVKQISLRGRDFEQSIKKEYLEQLNKHYESWIARYKKGPLLVVESDELDFVNKQEDLERLVRMIERKLG
ncbi:MAG: deoxynucleoside kinase [Bacteroidetes bacterium]|nr:deoxynucleoside kinase [Bacteroidota bacterium]MCW5894648.1 deoxynucleoside kinase [Bacteroidota bacterium]